MKKFSLLIIFLIAFAALFCGCSSMKKSIKIADEKDIFAAELDNIIHQQSQIRREQLLHSLRQENQKAETLSNIANFELMLNSYELSQTEKNKAMLKYFDRAKLYMQLLLMPEKKTLLLDEYIKNQLTFELASIFIHCSTAKMILDTPDVNSEDFNSINRKWQNIIANNKIEYDALRINDFDAGKLLPDIYYPMHPDKIDLSLENYRLQKKDNSRVRTEARKLYSALQAKYEDNFPLILLRMTFAAPHKINYICGDDKELKKDFAALLSEIIWLYCSEVLYNSMQSSYAISADFRNTVIKTTPSPETLDGCYRSIIAYELAYLKMQTAAALSPFENWRLPEDDLPELSSKRIAVLKYLLQELLDSI